MTGTCDDKCEDTRCVVRCDFCDSSVHAKCIPGDERAHVTWQEDVRLSQECSTWIRISDDTDTILHHAGGERRKMEFV